MTERCADLHAYVDGELDEAETAAFEAHLVTCDPCRAELPRLLALLAAFDDAAELAADAPSRAPHLALVADEPGAARPDEAAAGRGPEPRGREVASPAQRAVSPTELPRSRRRRWQLAGGLGAALAAAAVVVFVVIPRPPEVPSIAALMGPTRPFEARLGYPGTGDHRPVNVARDAGSARLVTTEVLQAEIAFEKAKNWHGVAVAALIAGDRERAAQAFTHAPVTPEVDTDRAALELLQGTPEALERGLDDVDRALAGAPRNAAAHWNRALVLAAMNLSLAAAREFDDIRTLGEPGWSTEAKTHADALRAQVVRRRTHWKQASDAADRMVDSGTLVPEDLTDVSGTVTVMFYDAVRSAPSRERVLALLPLAKRLDGIYRSTRLTSYVQRIATSDFQIRKPLADRYREIALVRAAPGAADALLDQLPPTGPEDIRMGAMVYAGRIAAQLDDYRRLAAATEDPWFALIAEQEAANAEIARHETAAAERRLREAIALARRERLALRALRLENTLIQLHKNLLELSQAAGEARDAYREAIAANEWVPEMNALGDLASIHHNRYAYGLARAYLTEIAERAGAGLSSAANADMDCLNRMYAYGSLANLSVLQRDLERARAEVGHVPTCEAKAKANVHAALILRGALIRSELYRLGHRAEDAQLARDSLAALRALPATIDPGKDALVAYLEGNLTIKDDPAAGRRSLREAIAKAGSQTGEFSVKARAYSYSLLALEAGRASAFDDAIAAVSETLSVHEPKRCAIAITVDAERSVVAFRDAGGAIGGQYVGARPPGALDVTTLVPAGVIDRMRSCERISVLTRAPVLGAGRLLPPDLAWSYQLADPALSAAPPSAAQHRLVVANPEAPPELNLRALGPYPDEGGDPGVTILRGADATPSRVVLAMQSASVIEFHTHGFLADDLFEASHLVLSPELDRRYALTPGDVAQVHFAGAPLVILGACHAATSSRLLEGGMGLAEAFLRAGAHAVIASPDAVQDLGAHTFFAAVRDRILQGVDPAIALRDERMRRLAASHDDTWVSGVVVFQ